jgi:rubrerythrin
MHRRVQQEGDKRIAYLFVAFASAQSIHAGNMRRILSRLNVEVPPFAKPQFEVGSTRENPITAANGQTR